MNVTFEEQKLPAGNMWYVNVSSGGSYSSTNGKISFVEINGTYSYVISSGNKLYRPNPFEGSFVPNSSRFPVQVTFILVTYDLTFSETGLTNGTFWSITINNVTRISTNDSINFRYLPLLTYRPSLTKRLLFSRLFERARTTPNIPRML